MPEGTAGKDLNPRANFFASNFYSFKSYKKLDPSLCFLGFNKKLSATSEALKLLNFLIKPKNK